MSDLVDPRLSALEAGSPNAARLAELASFAVRVDTGLLRRLRQALLPNADVSIESDLWFSTIVEARNESGFQIAPEIAAELRQRLVTLAERPAVSRVREVLAAAHARVSPAIRLEEEVNGIALEKGVAGQPTINTALRDALGTLARGGTDAIDVARWAVHAMPRLHPLVRETENARTLILSAAMLLRRRARIGAMPAPDVRIGALGWALPSTTNSQPVGVDFVPGGLQFRAPSTGVVQVVVPVTDPPVVEIEWGSGGSVRRRLAQAAAGTLVPLDGDPTTVIITTLAGDQYRVTANTGTNAPAASPAASLEERLLQACVQLEPLGRDEPICVAFVVGETLLVSVTDPVATYPIIGVHGDARQAEVIHRRRGDEPPSLLIGLKAIGPASAIAKFATALPLDGGSSEILRAAAAGFAAGTPRWHDVALEPAGGEPVAIRRGVLFDAGRLDSRALTAAFAGAPLVAGGSVVGAIVRIAPPPPQETYASIEFVGATYVKDIVERAQRAIRRVTPQSGRPLVFISYAKEDEDAAARIRDELAKLEVDVYHDRDLPLGSDWEREIERAIESSAVFVAILSKHALVEDERHFRIEWRRAEQHWRQLPRTSRFVLPIVVDDLSPSDERLPEFLRQLQWASAPGGKPDRNVLESIVSASREAVVEARRDVGEPGLPVDLFDVLLPETAHRALGALMSMAIGRTDPIVLVVTGSPRSPLGLLDWAVEQARPPGLERVAIHMSSEQAGIDATELAIRIASSAGVNVKDISELRGADPRRLVQGLLSSLDHRLADYLVTIDGLEDVTRADLIEFIVGLASGIATRSKSRVRLMLFGFDRPMPTEMEARVSRVRLEDVSRSDVVHLLVALLERMGKRNDTELVAQKATEAVFSSLRDEWEYGDLRERVEKVARQLMADGPTRA